MTTTKLAISETFKALEVDTGELLEIIRENMGNDRITERDLDRVTMPLGGGLSWTVPTLEGEETVKSLEGIIVHWTAPRAYWQESMEESGGGHPSRLR